MMLDAQKSPGLTGAGNDAAELDPSSLEQLRALDPQGTGGFVQRVLGTYLRSLERYREALEGAQARADLPALGQAAHALKSASASVGAAGLSRLCAEIEESVRESRHERLPALVASFVAEAQRVRAAVSRLLEASAS